MNELKKVEKSQKKLKELVKELQEKVDNKEKCSVKYVESVKDKINSEVNLVLALADSDPKKLKKPEYESVVETANRGLSLVYELQYGQLKGISDDVDLKWKEISSKFTQEVTDKEVDDLINGRS